MPQDTGPSPRCGPLRVIHLLSTRGRGGRGATALRMVRKLHERGHRVVLCCCANGVPETAGKDLGVRVESGFRFERGFRPRAFLADVYRLRALIREENPHLLHAHLPQESWVACWAARPMRPDLKLVRSRGIVVPVRPHALNRWLHNRMTDCLIVPCRRIQEIVCGTPAFDPEKVSLVYDGVDAERFRPDPERGRAFRTSLGIPPAAPLVGMVARVEPVKGHISFFEAAVRVLRVHPQVRLLACCDERTPGAIAALRAAARGMGLDENILRFTGLLDEVERAYSALDIYVLPSLGSEGSSRGCLEAMASGLPVVATTAGCLPELVQDGVTGRLVDPGDSEDLADMLIELLDDRPRAAEMGRRGRARVLAEFTEDRSIENLERVYREVAGGA